MSTTDQGIIVRPRGWQQSYGDGRQGVQNQAGVNKNPFAWRFYARQFHFFLLLTDSQTFSPLTDSFSFFTSDRQSQKFLPLTDSFSFFNSDRQSEIFASDREFQNLCVLDHGMPQTDSFKIFWLSTPDSFRMANIGR